MISENTVEELMKQKYGKDRLCVVSPDYFEILGTDRVQDTNKLFGEKFLAYRKAWHENPSKHIVGNFPLHLDVESTNTCNLRCAMCQIPFDKMKPGFIDMNLYNKILEEIKTHGLPSIKFNFRGEPLMHPKIDELVKKAKESGVLEVQFNSNGTLLTEEKARKLIDAGLDRIKFSVDSINPDTYNSIRIGADYEKTISRIISLIDMRNKLGKKIPSIQVQMVYMESNHKEVEDYLDFWEDKVNRIGISRYRSGGNITGEEERMTAMQKRIPCPQLWQRLVVLYDGTILMCCGDYSMKNPLGNVKKDKISDIWKSKTLENYRKLHLNYDFDKIDACIDCEVNYA